MNQTPNNTLANSCGKKLNLYLRAGRELSQN